MRAARLHGYERALELDEVPEPQLQGHHDVIVRVGGAGLCRTDLHIIEGIWQTKVDVTLPYTLGHENAGWVAAVGDAVTNVREGDAVIVHPLRTCGYCEACRRGEDMYCADASFPGIDADGGFADFLRTSDRALIKLAGGVDPVDVAPYADAGITAYRAAVKAARLLRPGGWAVVQGIGGLGHIAVQCLHQLCAARVIAVDPSPVAQGLARDLGTEHVIGSDAVATVHELTGGGAHVVIDFVGERGAEKDAVSMLRQGGTHIVVGYGGRVEVPTIDVIFSEIAVVGSLVGSHTELAELMTLQAEGKVRLHTRRYALDDVRVAIEDLEHGRIRGRGVLVPGGTRREHASAAAGQDSRREQ
ncbi:MAG TPA: NAD(P)-dependent alcohol dehydrogenase [Candidatus Dormibacteraeota bacterium]|nr:NAD(P)-dependent alcohol dehydrogenase [Candidatus Dormibacteraeota bacterium]